MFKRTGEPANKASNEPPWLVRAEVTIRHKTPEIPSTPRLTNSNVNEVSGLRMVYRWNENQPSVSSSSSSSSSPGYGFQRGNILFTSTPPARSIQGSNFRNEGSVSPMGQGVSISDSGYNSEQLSQQSHSRIPRYLSQICNRRCQSTCSITLSTGGGNNEKSIINSNNSVNSQISRVPQNRGSFNYPWSSTHEHLSARCRFSTVPEGCEDCAEGSTSSAFTTHFCTRVPEKHANRAAVSRDAASQTTDIETNSPILGVKSSKIRRKALGVRGLDEQKKRKVKFGYRVNGTIVGPSKIDHFKI